MGVFAAVVPGVFGAVVGAVVVGTAGVREDKGVERLVPVVACF